MSGVEWLATDRHCAVVEALQQREHTTAAGLADAADVSEEHVRSTLRRLVEAEGDARAE
ncbi:hypothetical protein [Halorientalis sp.]|uniref:hypothetical protein n=1 Tax=Halorientalis sp. TaxID=1931229 RepID=UPI0026296C32|nr:hypothetical protein [Halorientalis sp.]